MNDEIIERRFPPLEGVTCPDCFMGKKNDGHLSYGLNADGSTTMKYKPGTVCSTCNGKGRVKVTYTPID